jgi:hypothetical protein
MWQTYRPQGEPMELILESVTQYLLEALVLTLVTLAVIAWRAIWAQLKPMMQARLGKETFEQLMLFGETTVRWLEQHPAFRGLDGAKKKQLAILEIEKFAKKLHIPADDEMIDRVIEASVQIMNGEKPPKLDYLSVGGIE